MTATWFAINFWATSVMYFFFQYALGERGLTTRDTAWLAPAALPFGFAGYAAAGWLMDRVGRRPALALYLILASAAGLLCYRSESRALVAGCYVALQMLNGVWAIAATVCAELFPTELRATAMAVSHNLLGRLGMVLGPWVAGRLAQQLGSTGEAVSGLSLLPLLCLPVIWLALPETRRTRIA
jgi:putative MFS transporter